MRWDLDLFPSFELDETSADGEHAILSPTWTTDEVTLNLEFTIPTSDHFEWSEAIKTRIVCHFLIQHLPDNALREVWESLSEIHAFYATPARPRLSAPQPALMPATLGPVTVRPVFPVSEE